MQATSIALRVIFMCLTWQLRGCGNTRVSKQAADGLKFRARAFATQLDLLMANGDVGTKLQVCNAVDITKKNLRREPNCTKANLSMHVGPCRHALSASRILTRAALCMQAFLLLMDLAHMLTPKLAGTPLKELALPLDEGIVARCEEFVTAVVQGACHMKFHHRLASACLGNKTCFGLASCKTIRATLFTRLGLVCF